jgi:hypothetical protein
MLAIWKEEKMMLLATSRRSFPLRLIGADTVKWVSLSNLESRPAPPLPRRRDSMPGHGQGP